MGVTALLDTSVLTSLAKHDAVELQKLRAWLQAGNGLAIPRVAAYEFRRGVLCGAVDSAADQRGKLFFAHFLVVELDPETWEIAADIWAALYLAKLSPKRRDSDILIAATVLRGGFELATNNKPDFETIRRLRPSLTLAAW
jgi:predicted nucleic acid-binding protein